MIVSIPKEKVQIVEVYDEEGKNVTDRYEIDALQGIRVLSEEDESGNGETKIRFKPKAD